MFKNYIIIAWRNLTKNKAKSSINLLGLTLGISSCLLLILYVLHELSYENWNPKADDIYRVSRIFKTSEGVKSMETGAVAPPFGYYLPTEFSEVKLSTRLLNTSPLPVKYEDNLFNQKEAYFADENFFKFFPVTITEGSMGLGEPYTAMLAQDAVSKYFGNESPVNKTIRVNGQADVKISGVYAPLPTNSHIHPEILVSFNTLKEPNLYGEENLRTNWGNNAFFTYIMLPSAYDAKLLEAQFPVFINKHLQREYGGGTPSNFTSLYLRKLSDIHLHSNTDVEAEPNGNITRVYLFSVIALFIMLIACINYINLSTASSSLRAKEIGLRKTVGAGKRALVFQFLSESWIICFLATALAIFITWLSLPLFNRVTGFSLTLQPIVQTKALMLIISAPFLLGFLAGIYPALYMSSFQPVKTLKGIFKSYNNGISLRKTMVVSQFFIGIVLIIATITVTQQLSYLHNKTLGYNKDQMVILPYPTTANEHFEAFENELTRTVAFKSVTRASRIPTGRLLDNMGASIPMGDSMRPVTSDIRYINCDYNFASAFSIDMAAGRFFTRGNGTDSLNYVLNQAAVKAIGWQNDDEAIGKYLAYGGKSGQVVGVTKDFHFESMHQSISPMIFLLRPGYNRLVVKLNSTNVSASVDNLAIIWKKYFPETPFDYHFLDERFNRLYEAEQKAATIFTFFSIIAICIACLGLFGLSTFAVSQRIKEIGVRKVLGASVNGLVVLLAKDFLKLVIVAALAAFPIAWYLVDKWLAEFAYRISIHWWVFLVAGIIAIIVAFLTVSFQAIRAALMNPVKSLRSE